jgi:predicted lipoprotein with Yx(FWY)xxD motif
MRVRMGLVATPLLLLSLVACGVGNNKPQSTGQPAANQPATSQQQEAATPASVKIAQSDVGPILVDQEGRALYGFTKDKDTSAACDDDCVADWPPLTSPSTVAAGEGVDSKLLTKNEDGQAVYKEWKLYYYVGDQVAGDINGQGLEDEWFLVAPDGSLIKKTV